MRARCRYHLALLTWSSSCLLVFIMGKAVEQV